MKVTALDATGGSSSRAAVADRVADHTRLVSLAFMQRALQSRFFTGVGMSTEVVHDVAFLG